MMLRISISGQDGSSRIVKLEGKLLGPWVDEVRGLFGETDAGSSPGLDLSGLSFVDCTGTELLKELVRQGVRIRCCSPYVAELLHWNCERD